MKYRIEMDIETEAFIPNADMQDISDLNQHFEAIVGDKGDIKSFHVRKIENTWQKLNFGPELQ